MGGWLRQSTAATVRIGPFVDAGDGVTPETALTIARADIRVSVVGGDFGQTASTGANLAHDENGYYPVTLSTDDTATVGRLRVAVTVSGAAPVWEDFMVLPAGVYDSLVAGSDRLTVDVEEIGNNIITAAAIAADVGAEIAVSVGAHTVSDLVAAPSSPYTIDEILGWLLAIAKFKRTQTGALETVFQDNGSSTLATAAKSDNGTTFTREEYS